MKIQMVPLVLALSGFGLVGFLGLPAVCGVGVAEAADPAFALKLEVPPAKKGQRAVVKLRLVPGSGYHMNKDFPTSLVMAAPAGVTLEKPRQSAADAARFSESGADFEVALTAGEPGAKLVSGELKFAVCTATTCDPKREKVSFTLEVK